MVNELLEYHPIYKMLNPYLGHSLMITPKSVAKEGYKDVGMDDHIEEGYFKRTQEIQLDIIEDKWEERWSKGRTMEGAKRD